MKFPKDIEQTCKRRYFNSKIDWIIDQGNFPIVINLSPPTENEATSQLSRVGDWVNSWRTNTKPGEVVWREYHWRVIGKQKLPCKLILSTAKEIAVWAMELKNWNNSLVFNEMISLIVKHPSPQLLRSVLSSIENISDLEILIEVTKWFELNKNSNLYLRQLPIKGVHTKWIEKNREVLLRLVCEVRGISLGKDFHGLLGIRSLPTFVRIRILDPEIRAQLKGISEFSIRLDEFEALNLHVENLLIVENIQSGLALRDISKTIAIIGLGNAASILAQISWISKVKCHYWGDIDSYGFFILSNLRAVLPNVQSFLMDEETLLKHELVWSREAKQFTAEQLSCLTGAEHNLYKNLLNNKWGDKVRLEQERIDWPYAWERILHVIEGTG